MTCMYCTNYIHDTLMEPIKGLKSPSSEFKYIVGQMTREMYRGIEKNNRYFGIQHAFKIIQTAEIYGIDYKYLQFIKLLGDFPKMHDDMIIHMDLLIGSGCGMMKTLRYWYMEKFLHFHQNIPEIHKMHMSKIHPDQMLKESNDDDLYS